MEKAAMSSLFYFTTKKIKTPRSTGGFSYKRFKPDFTQLLVLFLHHLISTIFLTSMNAPDSIL